MIPANVTSIIENKKLAMRAAQEKKQKQEQSDREAKIALGREALRQKITETLEFVPEWLRQYNVTESTWGDDTLFNIGNGSLNKNMNLFFSIPELAWIQFRWDGEEADWRSQTARTSFREYGPEVPKLDFNNGSYWSTDLEFILMEAEQEFQKFSIMEREYQDGVAAIRLRLEEEAQREAKAEERRSAEQAIEETEEQQLFDAFKDDPVAIHLLKAFMMIRQERSAFEQQIENANDSLYSMEEHWTRKAADLRRQAENADRRAADEKYRLESDLSDAEDKLKKVQRGW